MLLQGCGEGNNNIGNNVGDADVAGFVHFFQQVAFLNGDHAVHMVMGHVFRRDADRVRIDIHGQHLSGAEKGGCDGQNAAAGTHVDDVFPA